MKKVELNVGMNIGTLGSLDYNKTKARILEMYGTFAKDIECQLQEGSYTNSEGVTQIEPTIVVSMQVDVTNNSKELVQTTANLCNDTFQECIAMLIHFEYTDNKGILIYNRDYRGTMQDFDIQYFLNFKNVAKS